MQIIGLTKDEFHLLKEDQQRLQFQNHLAVLSAQTRNHAVARHERLRKKHIQKKGTSANLI